MLPRALPLLCLTLVLGLAGVARGDADWSVVERWLATNKGIDTIRVDFEQSRKMRTVKSTLRDEGTLWIDYRGGRFRWQLGRPAETVVVKDKAGLLIVRPGAKQYERRTGEGGRPPGMAALATGFPRDLDEFRKRYRLLDTRRGEATHEIVAQPLDAAARGVRRFTFVVGAERHRLHAIEIDFRDGSSQRIRFTRVEPQAALAADLFSPDVTGFRAVTF